MCEELRAAAEGFKKSSKTCNKQEPMGLFFFSLYPATLLWSFSYLTLSLRRCRTIQLFGDAI